MTSIRNCIALALLLAPPLFAQQANPAPISFAEAVRMARLHAPAAIEARGLAQSTASTARVAKGALLPSLSSSWSTSRGGGRTYNPNSDLYSTRPLSPWSFSEYLNSSVSLFDPWKWYSLSGAKSSRDAANENETDEQLQLDLQVRVQFYLITSAQEALSTAEAQAARAGALAASVRAKGTGSGDWTADSLRAAHRTLVAEDAMVSARSFQAAENIALTRLVASPSLVTPGADAGADLPPLSASDDELVATAMHAPAVRFYEATLAAAGATVKGRRAAYLPVITGSVNTGWGNTDRTFDFGGGAKSYSYSYSFGASLPLFNGFYRENAITQARIQRDNAEARLNDFRMEVRQTVLTALENLRAAERRMAIQQSAAAMMETELRNSLRDYERGTRAFIDVLYAENALTEAQSRLIEARLDAKTARAQFEPLIAGGR